jgi:hypothetical protein
LRLARASNWPLAIALVCLVAGTVETALFTTFSVHRTLPDWNVAIGIDRAGIVTSAVCAVAAIAGLF